MAAVALAPVVPQGSRGAAAPTLQAPSDGLGLLLPLGVHCGLLCGAALSERCHAAGIRAPDSATSVLALFK